MKRWATPLLAAFATAGCAPCAGFLECRSDGPAQIEGRVIDVETLTPAGGVGVAAVRGADTSRTITESDGSFALQLRDDGGEDGSFVLIVTALEGASYRDTSFKCSRSTGGCPLPWLMTRPIFPGGGFVSFRGEDRMPVPASAVVFRRTSGVGMVGAGVSGDSLSFAIDPDAGHINLMPAGVFATDVGIMTGDLIVDLPPPLDSASVRGLPLQAIALFRQSTPPVLLSIGPSLKSRLTLTDASGDGVKGVVVRFVRRSGILADSTRFTTTSTDSGHAVINPRPFARGAIVGDIMVDATGAGGIAFTIGDAILATHDDDATVDLGRWNVLTGQRVSRLSRRPFRDPTSAPSSGSQRD